MIYRAALFDVDETLLDFGAAEDYAVSAMLIRLGLPPESGADYRRCNLACWRALEAGTLTQAQLRVKRFADFMCLYDRPEDPSEVAETYLRDLASQSILLPGALDTVRAVAARMPVALVTNGIADVQHGRLDHSPLMPYVSALVISEELGCAKPNPRMIHEALRRLGGIPPCAALMIGDSLRSDMACARNAGVDGCWLRLGDEEAPPDQTPRYQIKSITELTDLLGDEHGRCPV